MPAFICSEASPCYFSLLHYLFMKNLELETGRSSDWFKSDKLIQSVSLTLTQGCFLTDTEKYQQISSRFSFDQKTTNTSMKSERKKKG